jgi:hypothetical protein
VAGVFAAVRLERATDWVPQVLDALRYSEDVRVVASVLLGAGLGVVAFWALSSVSAQLHSLRVQRAARRAAVLRDRIGCGFAGCTRCPIPEPFKARARPEFPTVGGYLLLGAIAFAIYAGIAVGDSPVKLQRVGAVVPEDIRGDCRERPRDDGPIELVCRGASVSALGLRRIYFQFGNPSYETYGEGIFQEAAAFRGCGRWRSRSGLGGEFTLCGRRAAVWTDEKVVLGGAMGRRAARFARLQHLAGPVE